MEGLGEGEDLRLRLTPTRELDLDLDRDRDLIWDLVDRWLWCESWRRCRSRELNRWWREPESEPESESEGECDRDRERSSRQCVRMWCLSCCEEGDDLDGPLLELTGEDLMRELPELLDNSGLIRENT